MSISLRPFTRAEYHDFFRQYEPDPLMDSRTYRYQYTHVDRSFDYDQSRWEWYQTYGVFLDGEVIGSLALKRIDKAALRCEIGLMMVNDRYKNRGFGTQAMKLGMQLAIEQHGLLRIDADTMGSNLRMQHVLEKLGFRMVERVPHAYELADRREDRLCYVYEVEACDC